MTAASALVDDTVETADDVAAYLRVALGGGDIVDLRRLSAGASRQTWSFRHRLDGADERLVLRRDPPGGPQRHGSMGLEVAALRAAALAGVPVPRVVASGGDLGGTGTAYVVTEHVDGETLGPRIVRSPELAVARERFAAECGRTLAMIHRIEPSALVDAPTPDLLGEQADRFVELGTPSATVALALRLLDDRRPATDRAPVVVHGDFRNGNLIVGRDGLRSVLDWELVHVGDPLWDLGWLCTQAWAFGGREPVGGIGSYDDLLDGYAEVAGWRPELDDVRWWQLLGSVRWAVACFAAADGYATGAARTLDAAALARRTSENELDILRVIEELDW